MAGQTIGRVKTGQGKTCEVSWDTYNQEVYVSYAGWTYVGKASSAAEAMRKAEAFLYNK